MENKAIKRIDQGGRTGTVGNYIYTPAKTETYTYNADGSLASKTDRNGKTTVYVYDIHGRLQSQSIQNTTGSTISFTYDGNGNQLTMTDSTGTTTRTYDELGRVLTKTVPDIGTTTFDYDIISGMDEGCYAEIATDPIGHVTQKIFDKAGRLKKVTAGGKTTTYSYYDNGTRQSVTYNDGTIDTAVEEYTYYEDGLLWTLTNTKLDAAGNRTVIDSYSYTYDEAHNQISKIDAKGITVYTYDELNRLKTVAEPAGTITKTTAYTYDAAGNRENETITKGTEITVNTYTYNEQNRLTQVEIKVNGTLVTTPVYEYDYNGNQLITTVNGSKTVENKYDYWNQLIQTKIGTATTINAYNGEGYRVEKTVNGTLTRYLYEGDKVVLELDSSGYETARNVYGCNLIMREAIRTDGSNIFDTYFYLYNGHADVTALLKPDGTIAATYYYDAFGNITDTTGSANNNITFADYQYDAETGLYYLNARMYDPKTARFLQEDTYLGDRNDPLSLNLYTYCHNEPLMYTDPTGHVDELIGKERHAWLLNSSSYFDGFTSANSAGIGMSDHLKASKATYNKNKLDSILKDDREAADRRGGPNQKKNADFYKKLNSDYWNRTDGYFDGLWWHDEKKLREATEVIRKEIRFTGAYQLNTNLGYRSMSSDPEEINNRMFTIQALSNASRTGYYDEDTLGEIDTSMKLHDMDFSDHMLDENKLNVIIERYGNIKGKNSGNKLESGWGDVIDGFMILGGGATLNRGPVSKGNANSKSSTTQANEGTSGLPSVPTKTGGGSIADDFSTSHSFNRHQNNPNTVSTKSKTQYGENVDVQELRRQTLGNPDSVEYKIQKNPTTGDESHGIVYKKEFNGNISTPDTPTGSHRIFINLDNPEMSSHFPFYSKPKPSK